MRSDEEFVGMRALVELVLRNHDRFDWSIQGLGFFRVYLPGGHRIHLWDSRWRIKDATRLHTHPFHFTSFVMSGRIVNNLYAEDAEGDGSPYFRREIKCGAGACVLGDPTPVSVRLRMEDRCLPGEWYSQRASEIHDSQPDDGTVTVCVRELADPADGDHAFVYCPAHHPEFVSAEPRPASPIEVATAVSDALKGW